MQLSKKQYLLFKNYHILLKIYFQIVNGPSQYLVNLMIVRYSPNVFGHPQLLNKLDMIIQIVFLSKIFNLNRHLGTRYRPHKIKLVVFYFISIIHDRLKFLHFMQTLLILLCSHAIQNSIVFNYVSAINILLTIGTWIPNLWHILLKI